jgi:hypothetical protein
MPPRERMMIITGYLFIMVMNREAPGTVPTANRPATARDLLFESCV